MRCFYPRLVSNLNYLSHIKRAGNFCLFTWCCRLQWKASKVNSTKYWKNIDFCNSDALNDGDQFDIESIRTFDRRYSSDKNEWSYRQWLSDSSWDRNSKKTNSKVQLCGKIFVKCKEPAIVVWWRKWFFSNCQ